METFVTILLSVDSFGVVNCVKSEWGGEEKLFVNFEGSGTNVVACQNLALKLAIFIVVKGWAISRIYVAKIMLFTKR